MSEKQFDVIVYGATGFTGRLICAYLHQRASAEDCNWAMAGRSIEKLEVVRSELGASDVPLVHADADNPASIEALVATTRVVISAVGPYQLHGEALLSACVNSGTDYIDLCGEPLWMRDMIDRYEAAAKASGARILFSSGFDSIPAEMGVWLCQKEAMRAFGRPVPRIRGRMRTFVGGPSGGSMASGMAMMKIAGENPEKAALLANPFALTPGFEGPAHPDYNLVEVEADVGKVGPFTLGPTDMKNVHRSNFLQGHAYGTDFVYDEKLVNPPPPPSAPPSFDKMPKPGEGPSAEIMTNGRFDLLLIGEGPNDKKIHVALTGDEEPGYRTTSKLIAETAFCLIEAHGLAGGIWTPVAALADALCDRIEANTPISTSIETFGA